MVSFRHRDSVTAWIVSFYVLAFSTTGLLQGCGILSGGISATTYTTWLASYFLLIAYVRFAQWYYAEPSRLLMSTWHYHLLFFYRWLVSLIVERPHKAEIVASRTTFRAMAVPGFTGKVDETHTHPLAAASRSRVYTVMDLFAVTLGMKPYWYQTSASDQRRGRKGLRTWMWAKDTMADLQGDPFSLDTVVCLGDVDYYMDMPAFLCKVYPRPLLIYTINPAAVAGRSGEASFTFLANNKLRWEVAGGAVYEHHLWNYNHDVITAEAPGAPFTVTYLVERKSVQEHRELILLVPLSSHSSADSWLLPAFPGEPLSRLQVNSGRFSRLRLMTKDGPKVSTGLAGYHSQTMVTEQQDAAIAVTARVNKVELAVHNVASWLADHEDPNSAATNLVEYHRETARAVRTREQTIFPMEQSVRNYEIYVPHQTGNEAMVPYCSPIIHASYVPRMSLINDAWFARSRVIDLQHTVEMPIRDQKYMAEFIELLIPIPNILHPVGTDEVYERQARPSQRALLDQCLPYKKMDRPSSTFAKKESYPKIGDVRGITIISNTDDKRDYSQYTYAMAKLLERTEWYAFGKNGDEISQRITQLCATARVLLKTDFWRMDGNVSLPMRLLERAVFLRAFHRNYHEKIEDLLRSQYHRQCVSTHGVKYSSEYARLSGSPETAISNTIDNAFIAYCCFRDMGLSPKEAYKALGLYGGDDGATADADEAKYVAVARRLGQTLECTPVLRGSQGVDFLARWYGPEVWYGDRNSCSDIPRALRKFHVTPRMLQNITPLDKFFEKVFSLSLTDYNTPLLGHLARKAEKIDPHFYERVEGLCLSYAATSPVQYPNEQAHWMWERLLTELPGVNPNDFIAWSQTDQDPLQPPLVVEPEPAKPHAKLDVVVDDELVPARGKTRAQAYKDGKGKERLTRKNALNLTGQVSVQPEVLPPETSATYTKKKIIVVRRPVEPPA